MENLEPLQSVFSIAVAAFLLLRMEKRLAALTDAINQLRHCQACKLAPSKILHEEDVKSEV